MMYEYFCIYIFFTPSATFCQKKYGNLNYDVLYLFSVFFTAAFQLPENRKWSSPLSSISIRHRSTADLHTLGIEREAYSLPDRSSLVRPTIIRIVERIVGGCVALLLLLQLLSTRVPRATPRNSSYDLNIDGTIYMLCLV